MDFQLLNISFSSFWKENEGHSNGAYGKQILDEIVGFEIQRVWMTHLLTFSFALQIKGGF